MNISIVSNSQLLREALILLLKVHPSIHQVNSYASEMDRVLPMANLGQQVVLLDAGLGRELTIAQIQAWRSQDPLPHIVVVEVQNDSDLILDCIAAGAHGYTLQGASCREVLQVIEQVDQGVAQCSPEITAKLFDRLAQPKTVPPSNQTTPLTQRELEVLQWVAKNYSDRDISTELVIEVRTVKHHVHNILRKLNVKYRRDAAQLAINHGWLNLTSF